MAEKTKHPLRVNVETADALKAHAEEKGITLTEAAEQVIAAGLAALSLGHTKVAGNDTVLAEETKGILEDWAKAHGKSLTDAADRLINVGITRLQALNKYGAKQKKG